MEVIQGSGRVKSAHQLEMNFVFLVNLDLKHPNRQLPDQGMSQITKIYKSKQTTFYKICISISCNCVLLAGKDKLTGSWLNTTYKERKL